MMKNKFFEESDKLFITKSDKGNCTIIIHRSENINRVTVLNKN